MDESYSADEDAKRAWKTYRSVVEDAARLGGHITIYFNIIRENRGNIGSQGTYNENRSGGDPTEPPSDESRESGGASEQSRAQFKSWQDVENWFFDQDDIERQLYLLVVALFDGSSPRFIRQACEDLEKYILPEDEGKKKKKKRERNVSAPFQRRASGIMETIGIHEIERGANRAVTFTQPAARRHILAFIHQSVDLEDERAIIEKWLVEICVSPDKRLLDMGAADVAQVRTQSAVGLGKFARRNFDNIVQNVLHRWARSEHVYLHFVTGWVLAIVADDEAYRSVVFNRMHEWMDSGDWMLQWTAALSCSVLGLVDLTETLKLIEKALVKRNLLLPLAYLFSLQTLYQLAARAHEILDTFADWVRRPLNVGKNRERADLTLWLFLALIQGKFFDDRIAETQKETTPYMAVPGTDEGDALPDHSYGENGGDKPDIKSKPAKPAETDVTRASLLTIWQLIEKQRQKGEPSPESSVEFLVKQTFINNSAMVRDEMCRVIELWIMEADRHPSLRYIIVPVLEAINRDYYGCRHIQRIVRGKRLKQSKTAAHLRSQVNC